MRLRVSRGDGWGLEVRDRRARDADVIGGTQRGRGEQQVQVEFVMRRE